MLMRIIFMVYTTCSYTSVVIALRTYRNAMKLLINFKVLSVALSNVALCSREISVQGDLIPGYDSMRDVPPRTCLQKGN